MRRFTVFSILLFLFLFVSQAYAVDFSSALTPNYKQGELIVRFKDNDKGAKSLVAAKAGTVRSFKRIQAQQVKLPGDKTVAEALEEFRKDPNVLYAEPNYLVRKLSVPNDTRYAEQWNLPIISAPTAWNIYTGPTFSSNSIIVAMLDTGVAYTHPDLLANLWVNKGEIPNNNIDDDGNGIVDDYYGANFGGTTPGDPWDDDTLDSHGTHLTGIVGAVGNNSLGITGINWSVRVMAVKFLQGPQGLGELSDVLRGVEYAIAKGAKIINMSFEVSSDSQSLRDAVAAADRAGVLVVSAAGNSGKNLDTVGVYPASIRTANNISVAASTHTDTLASYSDYGRTTVDLAAPGGTKGGSAILSTVWLNNGNTLYRTTAGTSMAAPHVTGAAALIWNLFPTLTHYQVKERILKNVDLLPAFTDTTLSGGRLNLSKALTSFVLIATPTSGTLPLTVSLSASSSIAYTTWEWDLGDGVYKTIPGVTSSTTHTFNTAGAYTIRLRASNNLGQTGNATVTVSATAAPVPSGGGGGGGGCFIATAAWGSHMHPQVQILRDFRDRILLTSKPGRLFVKTYYMLSPPIADFISHHEGLRTATRWVLAPLIVGIQYPLATACGMTLFLLGVCMVIRHRRQIKTARTL